ncbi:CDP-glycerol glycerophosphotransferase family protein, partial [Streptomyces sp. MT29]|nr:CDP-glycerol glycerophosphotransferase family protein [Streptomyces sp. MT29]
CHAVSGHRRSVSGGRCAEQLVKAVRDVDAVEAEYREKYAQFKRDFCEPGDGLATARVVDRMLAGGPHSAGSTDG